MTTTTSPAPQLGDTCTVGSGKTRWEIVKVEQDGTFHLSKVGGDGYTNRWAKSDEVRNVQARTMTHSLGEVLTARQEAAAAAQHLGDQIKRHARPSALVKMLDDVIVKARRYTRIYAGHLAEVEFVEAGE
jgi:hypothetical protein